MRSRSATAAALAIVSLTGCGGGTPTTSQQDDPSAKSRRFTGIDADNYRTAYFICGKFTIQKIASDVGINSTDPATVADAYANDYDPERRQAPYDGCLDALVGDPPAVGSD